MKPYTDRLSPSIRYYGVGLTLGIIGVAVAVASSSMRLGDFFDSIALVKAPGRAEVVLLEKGPYLIYDEFASVYKGNTYTKDPGLEGLTVRISEKKSGAILKLEPAPKNLEYSFFGRKGVCVWMVEVSNPGFHLVETAMRQKGKKKQVAILAITRRIPSAMIDTVIGDAIIILLFTVAIAGSAFVVVFVLRQRSAEKSATSRS